MGIATLVTTVVIYKLVEGILSLSMAFITYTSIIWNQERVLRKTL